MTYISDSLSKHVMKLVFPWKDLLWGDSICKMSSLTPSSLSRFYGLPKRGLAGAPGRISFNQV